ncbi:alpha/beta fold hydrolase [Actinokineospora sp. NBRC 105648]|uniref:alpha/beta fold hydrolase n=1 Tax=Actinokineospora sp. NBRC 105648 TaxID=3032206 RepID=UPI0024A03176|nr:alpha/beta fold hydrolase [Actinokineospora sp. NBRC 105648]GLZ39080.1 hypothetical protein Acsp05_27040 [Actinokineospora sp. NBRC 105648]
MSEAADEVCAAVADVAPLLTALGAAQRAALDRRARPALAEATALLGVPAVLVVDSTAGFSAAEVVITRRLARAPLTTAFQPGELAAAAARRGPGPVVVRGGDGAALRAHVAGPVGAPAVAVVSACGMPAGLVSRWVSHLAAGHRVVTWETRGLFDDEDGFDARGHDLATQAADLLTVLEAFVLERVHVVGLCGGAAIALAAAHSPRVASLSLWHGDYELAGAAKTEHQRDMQSMLVLAGRERARAEALHRVFRRASTVDSLRPDIAHHLYYPYATAELLYRYGRLNGAIMTTDCGPLLAAVSQPTLVVTSPEDDTAHPDGSRHVAARLAHARLHEFPHGDHLAAFDADARRLALATDFIAETRGGS